MIDTEQCRVRTGLHTQASTHTRSTICTLSNPSHTHHAVSLNFGIPHPGQIVEGNALASVQLPPVTYPLREGFPEACLSRAHENIGIRGHLYMPISYRRAMLMQILVQEGQFVVYNCLSWVYIEAGVRVILQCLDIIILVSRR